MLNTNKSWGWWECKNIDIQDLDLELTNLVKGQHHNQIYQKHFLKVNNHKTKKQNKDFIHSNSNQSLKTREYEIC